MAKFDKHANYLVMKDLMLEKEIKEVTQKPADRVETKDDSWDQTRPLSKKAQEAKIFLERNPIPKEFLKKK
ncbi:hypothetical protein [Dyadobacter chenhuakuii]|uniref:Uncharacterized protein n=1 Tax=Dyadobacter chenhuakuii TaxID=2909339 RepID=A0A9X1QEX0_9BACT|nr:hypothetical protein [Dyadobacter chenhuakuii]MCF2499242.1 hypothetical protein [Dyadobacter chenhuakuii]